MLMISGVTFTSLYYIFITSKNRKFASTDFLVRLRLHEDKPQNCRGCQVGFQCTQCKG